MDPASREGEGRGWGERRRRRPGSFFHPGFLLPAAPAGGRGESSEPAARPSRARSGPATGALPPADWPFPHLAEAPPTTRGRAGRALAPRRGPAAQPGASCRARAAEPKRLGAVAALFWPRARGPDAVRAPPPESPRMRDLWGGVRLEGAKMALGLARRQDWWRSCSAGAIFPGGAGGALRGRFAGRGAGRSGATGSCAQGVGFCKWGRGRAAEPASPRSLGLPQAPRPKGRAGRLRAGRARGGGAFLRSSCVCGKKWAGGRALQLVGSLSEPASPFGQNWR